MLSQKSSMSLYGRCLIDCSLTAVMLHALDDAPLQIGSNADVCPACRRQGKEYQQTYRQGQPVTELLESKLPSKIAKKSGTQVKFLYDKGVFTKG